nr:DsbA family protein [Enterovirga sp. DB1703]
MALAAVSAALPAGAQTFGGAQKEEIGRIVREYLIQNPEVIQEAIVELERRQTEAQKTAQTVAIRETRNELLASRHGNIVGNPAGDVTLVEFFDYNCGYCKHAVGDIQGLIKADPKLRVVLRDLPVLGQESLDASRIALAAKAQLSGEKLFEYHTRLLATRGRVGAERALGLAREMGLDVARLQKDAAGPEVAAALDENRRLAERLAINGTPAFIIGEEVIPGAVGAGPLRQAIAGMRQCGHAVC